MSYLIIFLGGGLGAILRFSTIQFVELLSHRLHFLNIHHAIIIVNFIGCIIYASTLLFLTKKLDISDNLRLFILTGLIASYTTFSTFVFEAFDLFYQEGLSSAIQYFLASLLFSFIGFFIIYRIHVQNTI